LLPLSPLLAWRPSLSLFGDQLKRELSFVFLS
jgi:hypothetical protein